MLKKNIKRNQKVGRMSLKDYFYMKDIKNDYMVKEHIDSAKEFILQTKKTCKYHEDLAITAKLEADGLERRNKQAASDILKSKRFKQYDRDNLKRRERDNAINRTSEYYEQQSNATPDWATEEMTEQGCKVKMFTDKKPEKKARPWYKFW